jgi:hypothetical protein
MMPGQVELILNRYDKLKAEKGLYEALLQDIASYILPRKSNITLKRARGAKQTEVLYDSTAIHGCKLLAANMHGSLTSPASKWFSLKLRIDAMNEDKEISGWLEMCANRMYLALRQSNFNSEAIEIYLDLIAMGTAALFIEEKPPIRGGFAGFQFKASEIGEYVIDEGPDGRVDTLMRLFEMSARNIVEKWGNRAGEKVRSFLEREPDKPFEIIHAVYPRGSAKTKKEQRFPWASCYLLKNEKQFLSEGGFHEFPYMVPRWGKTAGEIYGRGPGHDALPDVKTLNKLVELTLKALAKVVDPPMKMKSDGVVGSVKLTPGGVTIVKAMENLEALETGTKWDVVELKTEELKQGIRAMFFNDQLQLSESPQMTATEVSVRYEMMQRLLGPTLGRLESELLNPMIERCFNIMYRAGALPQAPAKLMQMGSEIDIEYEGPLAKSQRAGEVTAIEGFLAIAKVIGETDPSAMDIFDIDKALRHIGNIRGVPQDVMRSEEEIKKRRAARARAMVEAQKKQDALMEAEAVSKLAGAEKSIMPQQGGMP